MSTSFWHFIGWPRYWQMHPEADVGILLAFEWELSKYTDYRSIYSFSVVNGKECMFECECFSQRVTFGIVLLFERHIYILFISLYQYLLVQN